MTDPWAQGLSALDALGTTALGIAVSGGGDSMALLAMAREWRDGQAGRQVFSATVDHNLRPESGDEAKSVAQIAASWDIPHQILTWTDAPNGNLQASARDARRRLLADWAGQVNIPVVCLGHTRDDVAETFLMRLARGSGVDGLSRMSQTFFANGQVFARPMLMLARDDLRDMLRTRGITWIDDPSNDDTRFDRVRVRQAMAHLAPLGITAEQLANTATRLSATRDVLEAEGRALADRVMSLDEFGVIRIDRSALLSAHVEHQMRLLSRVFRDVSENGFAPRRAALDRVQGLIDAGVGRETLCGMIVTATSGALIMHREPARMPGPQPYYSGMIWDNRWQIVGAMPDGTLIAPVSESYLRETELSPLPASRNILRTTPMLCDGTNPPIALVLEQGLGCHATLLPQVPGVRDC